MMHRGCGANDLASRLWMPQSAPAYDDLLVTASGYDSAYVGAYQDKRRGLERERSNAERPADDPACHGHPRRGALPREARAAGGPSLQGRSATSRTPSKPRAPADPRNTKKAAAGLCGPKVGTTPRSKKGIQASSNSRAKEANRARARKGKENKPESDSEEEEPPPPRQTRAMAGLDTRALGFCCRKWRRGGDLVAVAETPSKRTVFNH